MGDFVPGYEAIGINGLGVPRNTPAEIVNRLNTEINTALADPQMEASPAEFKKLIADEVGKWAKVIKFANIKAE